MSKKGKEDPRYAFHFTSEEGIKGIIKSEKINASVAGNNDDVTFGANKVYLTSLHPEKNTPLDIATNNYDGSKDYAKTKLPSTKYAIGFETKEIGAKPELSSRSIQTVKGDLDLSKAQVVYE